MGMLVLTRGRMLLQGLFPHCQFRDRRWLHAAKCPLAHLLIHTLWRCRCPGVMWLNNSTASFLWQPWPWNVAAGWLLRRWLLNISLLLRLLLMSWHAGHLFRLSWSRRTYSVVHGSPVHRFLVRHWHPVLNPGRPEAFWIAAAYWWVGPCWPS